MWNSTFWRQAAERAVKTAAQAAVALLAVDGLGLLAVDWTAVGSAAGLAAVVSVLTSVASGPVGPSDSPSLVPTVPRQPGVRVRFDPPDDAARALLREAIRKADGVDLR